VKSGSKRTVPLLLAVKSGSKRTVPLLRRMEAKEPSLLPVELIVPSTFLHFPPKYNNIIRVFK
jgi:hypothetical protein